jgi:predicted dehydrogenase
MAARPLRYAVVGCGNIAGPYGETLRAYPHLKMVGASDVDVERARAYTAKYGGRAFASLDEMLAQDELDVVVNLTIHHAHPEVITRCLEAGKHVHSEKPLALTCEDARAVVELAERKGLRLSCSPINFMGEAQQTAWKQIREGALGRVRVVYADVNWGRVETGHPAPAPFFEVGALFDVGVYPLTTVTTFFGPARRATAFGTVVLPDRVTRAGVAIHVETPDWMVAAIEMADGTVVRLTTSFYVGAGGTKQRGLEFHGDAGSLYLSSIQDFNASVEIAPLDRDYKPVRPVKKPFPGIEWGRALVEMADAMAEDRPQRPTGAQAAHVVEIACAIQTSARERRPVDIHSNFTPPAPMDWAR